MTDADIDQFFELLDATYDLMGKTPAAKIISAGSKALFFEALREYPIEQIRVAMAAHVREGTFTPVPNDIRVQINKRVTNQWLSADEAWARIPKAQPPQMMYIGGKAIRDWRSAEPPPCLLNQVTATAMAVAQPLLDEGDDVAARMAFRAAYNRLMEQEQLAGRAPQHFLSPGGTEDQRQAVVAEGVRQGLLPQSAAPDVKVLERPTPMGMKQIRQIRAMIAARPLPTPEDQDYD